MRPAGLADRRRVFRWLLDMGSILGGPSCLCGGLNSTHAYLDRRPSPAEIAPSWTRYFDTNANDGQPWRQHVCPPESDCTRVAPAELIQLATRHEGRSARPAARCVSVHFDPFDLKHADISVGWKTNFEIGAAALVRSLNMTPAAVPDSKEVVLAAQAVVQSHGAYDSGVVHIRRRDKKGSHARGGFRVQNNCSQESFTEPERVLRLMRERGLRSWIVMHDRDAAYKTRFSAAEHRGSQGNGSHLSLHLLFDSDFGLATKDNYFLYAVGVHLMQRAKARSACLDFRYCNAQFLYSCGGLWGRELAPPRW